MSREAFEKWAEEKGYNLRLINREYIKPETQHAYVSWQASQEHMPGMLREPDEELISKMSMAYYSGEVLTPLVQSEKQKNAGIKNMLAKLAAYMGEDNE